MKAMRYLAGRLPWLVLGIGIGAVSGLAGPRAERTPRPARA